MRPNVLRDTVIDVTRAIFTRRVDQKEYELKDHLGNVRVVVSDMKTRVTGTNFTLIVKSVNNYYAFGMLEEGMSGSSGDYRYGYNGKEMDNELKGTGNSLDYGARMYDARLGRWGSVDPLAMKYPAISSYAYVGNSPIISIDKEGKDITNLSKNPVIQLAMLVLMKTVNGKELINNYQVGGKYAAENDIYINSQVWRNTILDYLTFSSSRVPAGLTLNNAEFHGAIVNDIVNIPNWPGKTTDFFSSTYNGVKIENLSNKIISLVGFDDDRFALEDLNEETVLVMAETMYHELYAHIEAARQQRSQELREKQKDFIISEEEGHEIYGNTYYNEFEDAVGEALEIINQLKSIDKNELKNMIDKFKSEQNQSQPQNTEQSENND